MIPTAVKKQLNDPVQFLRLLWPDMRLYDRQEEIVYSVKYDSNTVVPAGNMLGKDFIAGRIAVAATVAPGVMLWPEDQFPYSTEVRIITTSVKDDHLRVLWGEIGRAIQECAIPLRKEDGGPLVANHRDIRKWRKGKEDKISYLRGMVSERGEGMAGHHAASTLLIIDEASGVDNHVFDQGDTWAKRKLIIGNCNPCPPTQFFHKLSKGGDVPMEFQI
jgi:hypothetical protein